MPNLGFFGISQSLDMLLCYFSITNANSLFCLCQSCLYILNQEKCICKQLILFFLNQRVYFILLWRLFSSHEGVSIMNKKQYKYIYIYIYMEREREIRKRNKDIYVNGCVFVYIQRRRVHIHTCCGMIYLFFLLFLYMELM